MYTYEVILKNVQETVKSLGIIGKSGGKDFRGKFRGNRGKIGELCFLNGETKFPGGEINFLHVWEKNGK